MGSQCWLGRMGSFQAWACPGWCQGVFYIRYGVDNLSGDRKTICEHVLTTLLCETGLLVMCRWMPLIFGNAVSCNGYFETLDCKRIVMPFIDWLDVTFYSTLIFISIISRYCNITIVFGEKIYIRLSTPEATIWR